MKELYEKYLNKSGTVFVGGLTVDVKVIDVKISYGRERFRVTPIKGKGEIWTESVTLSKK